MQQLPEKKDCLCEFTKTTFSQRKFEIFDEVHIYRSELKSKANGGYVRGQPTGLHGKVRGYAITDEGWEYFIKVAGHHSYNKWVREIGLESKGDA